jgi:hypothetical protein
MCESNTVKPRNRFLVVALLIAFRHPLHMRRIPLTGVRQHLRTEPHTAPAQPGVHGSDFKRQRNRPR